MKMNTEFDEDVSGQIVGSYTLMGSLHYEGRKQGNTIYAGTEDALHTAANENLHGIYCLHSHLGSFVDSLRYPGYTSIRSYLFDER